MKGKISLALATIGLCYSLFAAASEVKVTLFTTADNSPIGFITFKDTKDGLLINPMLNNLPPNLHGFHVHQNPACGNKGDDAGGHFDPAKTNNHAGPYADNGHRGDLPALFVDKNGNSTLPVLAPHLTSHDLRHHSVILHVGGDNYSDAPQKLGGGDGRYACGVIN